MPNYKATTIAYQESGLIKDRQAFVTPNDAFVSLENAYVFRGITKRKLGYDLLGRLCRTLSNELNDIVGVAMSYNAVGLGSQPIDVFTIYGINILEPNAVIDVPTIANPFVLILDAGGGSETILTDSTGTGSMVVTGGAPIISSATINYATGVITGVFTATPGALTVTLSMIYCPGLPAMGICQRELAAINAEDTIFFDTRYAYIFSAGVFSELPSTTPTTWQGSDKDFFWFTNFFFDSNRNKLFWVTNGNFGASVSLTDPIKYYDGSTWNATPFLPAIKSVAGAGNNFLISAKIIIPYRGRLVTLNTYEAVDTADATVPQQFSNRARWSQNGDPTNITASTTGGWIDDIQGFGGFLDAPTNEDIISCAFIRDILIVFFERSTWKLRYTGNETLPFVFERINVELGCESRFSPIRFDEGVLAVGDKGIITCNGNNVTRIDQVIRDEVFKIHNGNDGVERVHGIRDFFEQVVYWTFPAANTDPIYPNRVLLYNYDNNTWAFFKDGFTVLGNYQPTDGVRWNSLTNVTWEQYVRSWDSGSLQSQFPSIVAGNQQGYILLLNQKIRNDQSLYIYAISGGSPTTFTSDNHGMEEGDIIEINGVIGSDSTILNNYRFSVFAETANTFQLQQKPRFNITAITKSLNAVVTAPGHNFRTGDLCQFLNVTGMIQINNLTGTVKAVNGSSFTININSLGFSTYIGGGTAENLMGLFEDTICVGGASYIGAGEISRVDNFSIVSKKFNMTNQGKKTQLGYLDFFTSRTENGQVDVPIYIDYNEEERVNPKGGDPSFNWGFETTLNQFSTANQNKEWHRLYCNVEAQYFQYEITLSEAQQISKTIQGSNFELDAIIIWSQIGGRLVR